MGSAYRERKCRIFFRYLDKNCDGRMYRQEIVQRIDKFSTINVLNEEESDYTRKCYMKYCNYIFPVMDAEKGLNEDEFVEMQANFRKSEEWPAIRKSIEGVYNVLFDRLNSNRDGRISPEELKFYYTGIASADDKFIDRVFKKFDLDGDGEVTKPEFIKVGVGYWASEDEGTGYEVIYDVHN